jgi:hypothetical protein
MSRFSLSRVSGAPVSDAELLADMRRVAEIISKTTVRQKEYREHGKYDPATQASRFGSWNKALIAAGLGIYERSTSAELLLADLRRVAKAVSQATVSIEQYRQLGKHDRFTVTSRFGSWKKALAAAGLGISKKADIPDDILFENILRLWQYYGRQPRRSELPKPPSTVSQGPYWRRFGSWTNALERFVEFVNAAETVPPRASETKAQGDSPGMIEPTLDTHPSKPETQNRPMEASGSIERTLRRRTPRDPSLRLRFKVLQRDNFSCRRCGQSPSTVLGVILHVDHHTPWSQGGETVFENLWTLCEKCNLGKGDLVPDER